MQNSNQSMSQLRNRFDDTSLEIMQIEKKRLVIVIKCRYT